MQKLYRLNNNVDTGRLGDGEEMGWFWREIWQEIMYKGVEETIRSQMNKDILFVFLYV